MEIEAKYTGYIFSLMGKDVVECFEGVESFKYLGRVLHRSDKDWSEVEHLEGEKTLGGVR